MSDNSPEIRRRAVGETTDEKAEQNAEGPDSQVHSDEEDTVLEEENLADLTKDLPQATDKTTETLDSALSGLSARWRNWVVRGIFSVAMILSFGLIVYLGPMAVMLLVLAIQVKCFKELIDIGYAVYRVHNLPWFRTLSWFFLGTSEYFFLGEAMIDYFRVLLRKTEFLTFMVKYHRFISFSAYIAGFVWFVLSLKKSYYMRQFSLFAWTHVTLLIIVAQSYLIIQNIFQGMIWFLVPVSMIICNDIMAYIFGFFFGRTPLIKLSPKKTWEGFIGGAVSTVVFGVALSYFLLHYPRFICPIEFYDENRSFVNCDIPFSFLIHEYQLPKVFGTVLKVLRISPTIRLYPFTVDTVVLALFVSLVGPFGGFFASGFKRAFKIKDFGDVIPGHGGLMDRFDCQLLMGTFVNVYIYSFIRGPNPANLVRQILVLRPDEQMSVFTLLKEKLETSGLLNETISSLI